MKITWIAGYPKSGTTWLRAFLSAYVHGTLDINNLRDFSQDDLNPLCWQNVSCRPLPEVSVSEAAILRGAAALQICVANKGEVALRTHSSIGEINGYPIIPACLTDCAVQVVRDPRDIAVSFAHYLGCSQAEVVKILSEDTAHQKQPGLYWMLADWSRHVMSWKNAPFPCATIRYEDMCGPSAWPFKAALAALDIEMDSERFQRALSLTNFKTLQRREIEEGFNEMNLSVPDSKFFRRGQAGAWKDELDLALAKQIEDQHGEVMRQFGYETNEERQDEKIPEAVAG